MRSESALRVGSNERDVMTIHDEFDQLAFPWQNGKAGNRLHVHNLSPQMRMVRIPMLPACFGGVCAVSNTEYDPYELRRRNVRCRTESDNAVWYLAHCGLGGR